MNALRIHHDNGKTEMYNCCKCFGTPDGSFDDVYSYKHALKKGWAFHEGEPGVSKATAVCPDCQQRAGKTD